MGPDTEPLYFLLHLSYLTDTANDFSLGLVFTGGGINMTDRMAVDAMGHAWSKNYSYYVNRYFQWKIF